MMYVCGASRDVVGQELTWESRLSHYIIFNEGAFFLVLFHTWRSNKQIVGIYLKK